MPFVPGDLFRKFSERRCPVPRQVPRKVTRRTSSSPSSVTPALERAEFGGVREHAVAEEDPRRAARRPSAKSRR